MTRRMSRVKGQYILTGLPVHQKPLSRDWEVLFWAPSLPFLCVFAINTLEQHRNGQHIVGATLNTGQQKGEVE